MRLQVEPLAAPLAEPPVAAVETNPPAAPTLPKNKPRSLWPIVAVIGGAVVLVAAGFLIFNVTSTPGSALGAPFLTATSTPKKTPLPTLQFTGSTPTPDLTKPVAPEAKQAVDYYEKAKTALGDRKFQESIDAALSAVSIAPNFAGAYVLLGQAYYEINNYSDALKAMDRAFALTPKTSTIFRIRGLIYDKNPDPRKGIEAWTKYIELQPKEDTGYYWRGLDYKKLALPALACDDLKRADENGSPLAKKEIVEMHCF